MGVLSRRGFLGASMLGALGLGVSACGARRQGWMPFDPRESDFTFLHLTDMHVRRKRKGDEGYATCIDIVNRMKPKPELVLMGGDMAFDGLYTERDEFEDQIEIFKSVSDRLDMPWHPCIGNHDVLGLSSRRKVPVDDPEIGAKMIMNRLGMEKTYFSFDHRGWHFVVLDSIHQVETNSGPSYEARFGREQLDWLRFDLGANAGKPTVCVTHIAVFCNLDQVAANANPNPYSRIVRDNKEAREIFERHGVKAVLQGHMHVVEDYFYNGVWYITSQSVSAAWWGGNWRGFKPGFTILTARGHELGWKHVDYPWEHQLEPEDTLERERIAEQEEFERQQRELLEEERAGVPV